MSRNAKRYLDFVPVPALLLIIAILHFIVKPSLYYEPSWLLPVTNTLFVTVVCFIIAYIASRNYRTSGRIQVLLLGCGVFAFGSAAVLAAFLRNVPVSGANLNVTVYNTGALVAAIFHFIAALVLLSGGFQEARSRRKGLWAAGSYASLAVFMFLFSMASIRGMIPPFFVQGVGATPLRQDVLGTADALFAFSFLVLMGTYLRNRESFLYWYASALALTAISLTGFYIQSAVGSPIGWASRFSQYLGGIYFLIAVVSAVKGAQTRRTSFETILTAALSPAEEKFRALSENSPDIITRFDREMKHIYVNHAGTEMYGKPSRSIIGKTITESGLPEDYGKVLQERIGIVIDTGRPTQMEAYLPAGDGTMFYQSRCVPEYGPDGTVANVLVISRDLTERKQAEIALQESEQRWATTLASIGDAVIATDARGMITFMNGVAEGLTGWTLAEAATNPVTDVFRIINEQSRKTVENPVARVLREGMIVGLANHTVLIRRDGTEVAIDDSAAPIRYKDGNVMGVVLVFRDITERKRAEEGLRELNATLENRVAERTAETLKALETAGKERRRLYDVLETLPVYVILLTPEYHVPFANNFFRSRFGESEGRRCYEYLFNRTEPCEICETYTVLKTGAPHHWYWTGPDKRDYDIYDYPFVDADGSTMILEMGIDITEQKQAQRRIEDMHQAVNVERQRLYDVLETVPAMVCLLTPDYEVPFANRAFRKQFGDANGRKCFEYCYGKKEPCDFCESFKVLRTGEPHHWEVAFGGHFIDAYDFPFADVDGSPLILEMDLDITEQRQAEKEKMKLEAQLRQSQKMESLGTLTGGIAHDFNNILAAIIGFGEIAMDKAPADAKLQKALARVLDAGLRGRDLVKHMLTFARQGEQERKPLPLSSILKETTKLLRASIPTTISIRTNIRSESGYVFADPVQMQQVIMNLCSNAAHAMRETGGVLDVEMADYAVSPSDKNPHGIRPGLYMKLVVRDTGVGISPDIINRIFDPFYTTKAPGEGTGLGLSVVHGIIRQHEGYITVESRPGKGSAFTVYLPKVLEEEAARTATDETVPMGHERILLVDDEEALVEMGRDLLEGLGYTVTVKGNGLEALSAVQASPSDFDLIITDQTMPEMTGLQLATEVSSIRPDLPVILCTGFSNLVDAEKARAAGICAFAMKPLTKGEIARAVRKVLGE